ncbi:MAG: flagellar hook capping FlgD N-terminal domain-containing protein [Pseudomonadota bacterium]
MDIPALSSTTASSSSIMPETASDSGSISANFDTFLALLTAQLSNQDPLQPMDSTEFVAQLAQFSAVEQQVLTNDTLKELLNASDEGPAGLASWLNSEVKTETALNFSGEPIALTVTPDEQATTADLVVRDASGELVARTPVDPTAETIEWSGDTLAGVQADAGFYAFTVERTAGGATLPDAAASGFARVVEVRLAEGATELVLESGDVLPAINVTALRAPTS